MDNTHVKTKGETCHCIILSQSSMRHSKGSEKSCSSGIPGKAKFSPPSSSGVVWSMGLLRQDANALASGHTHHLLMHTVALWSFNFFFPFEFDITLKSSGQSAILGLLRLTVLILGPHGPLERRAVKGYELRM